MPRILITGNPRRRTRADFVAAAAAAAAVSDYILKESRRSGEGATRANAPLTLREQKQEEFTLLLLLLSLLPRFEERERDICSKKR